MKGACYISEMSQSDASAASMPSPDIIHPQTIQVKLKATRFAIIHSAQSTNLQCS